MFTFLGGNLLRWIEIAIIAGALLFIGALWISRDNALRDLDKANKSAIEATLKLTQITTDIQDVRVKQEVAVTERDRMQKQTTVLLNTIKNKKVPADCKKIVDWAVQNQADTGW